MRLFITKTADLLVNCKLGIDESSEKGLIWIGVNAMPTNNQ